jgi:uncharacterized protein (TIGR03437 family)
VPILRLTVGAFTYAAVLAAAPSITAIYNAASYAPPSLPNSGIAQGSIFTLFGGGLGPTPGKEAFSYPLPTTQGLGGTTIQVMVSGVTTNCVMIYTSNTQVNAILPSATPLGTGTLTVSYQGATGSISVQVLAGNFGTLTLNSAGSGPAVVTDASYVPITMVNAAHPGDTLILWGTGLGAASGDETEPPRQVNLNTGVEVLVGDKPATVSYGGRGSSPGEDQINFVVPAEAGGCKVSIAVVVKGVTGNVTTTSVAPAGQTTCGDTYGSLTTENLQKALATGSLKLAGVDLYRVGDLSPTVFAGFGNYPVNTLIRSFAGSFGPSIGNCTAYEVMGTSFAVADPYPPAYLDAGQQLTITGPLGAENIPVNSMGVFSSTLLNQPSTYVAPGAYSATDGSGGATIGPFTWNLTLPDNVVPTNIPGSINLAHDLTLTWTGGAAFPVVTILGYSGVPLGSSVNSYAQFVCNAAGSAGTFTIPSAILKVIPPNGYGSVGVRGVNIQLAGISSSSFQLSGIDEGFFTVYASTGSVAKIE